MDLNSPKNKRPAIPADKLKALLALKGKTISKKDPNYVAKRKRSDESCEQSQKRVALSLMNKCGSESNGISSNNTATEAEKYIKANETQKVVRSFTGEILDEKRIQELRNKKSTRSHLADEAELQEEDCYFDRLQKKEAMEDKVII